MTASDGERWLADQWPEPRPERVATDGFRERCDSCGQDHHVVWSADNALWNAVVGSPNGKRCPTCFDREAEAAGYVVLFRASAVRRAAGGEG